MKNQIVLSDAQLNEILEELHIYVSFEECDCYGLPMSESQMEDMRTIIRRINYTSDNEQLNEVLEELDMYASDVDRYCYGLPKYEMEGMRQIIRRNVITAHQLKNKNQ